MRIFKLAPIILTIGAMSISADNFEAEMRALEAEIRRVDENANFEAEMRRLETEINRIETQQRARAAQANERVSSRASGQTAQARGAIAERRGNEAEALANYRHAARLDPSLQEAARRAAALETSIRSGRIGDDVRSSIELRRDWVARLTETERFFANLLQNESMPYTLFYTTEITRGRTNYQTETIDMSIQTHLHGSCYWTLSIEEALQAVYDGLRATGRAQDWGLAGWPRQGVTNLNAFGQRTANFNVVFELVNEQGRVISTQTLRTSGSWSLSWAERPNITVNASNRQTLNFQNVNANHITDRMTIRVATVNGTPAATAARDGLLQVRAVNNAFFAENDRFRFSRGTILGFAKHDDRPERVTIPDNIWGDPVVSIGNRAFANTGVMGVSIPRGITLGTDVFSNNRKTVQGFDVLLSDDGRSLTIISGPRHIEHLRNQGHSRVPEQSLSNQGHLIIPEQLYGTPITRIGERAFENNRFRQITIPSSVVRIDTRAFAIERQMNHNDHITIGANVSLAEDAFGNDRITQEGRQWFQNSFVRMYNEGGRRTGEYRVVNGRWHHNISDGEVEQIRRDSKRRQNIGLGVLIGGLLLITIIFVSASDTSSETP
jgi:hypothetical protein